MLQESGFQNFEKINFLNFENFPFPKIMIFKHSRHGFLFAQVGALLFVF